MRFVISLLYILFAITIRGQDTYQTQVLRCYGVHVPGIKFILKTTQSITNVWHAGIVLTDLPFTVERIVFDFDQHVDLFVRMDNSSEIAWYKDPEIILDPGKPNSTRYVYENNAGDVEVCWIAVRSKFLPNNLSHLTRLEFNWNSRDYCPYLTEIPNVPINYQETSTNRPNRQPSTSSEKSKMNSGSTSDHTYCGKILKKHVGLITRGYTASQGDWPWHAALYHIIRATLEYKCGGSLITRNAVLTAAHCLYEGSSVLMPEKITIRLGLLNRFRLDTYGQEFQVYQVIPHENFNITNSRNDIGIVQLATEPVINDYVRPVCLWYRASIRESEGEDGYVVGWGLNEKQEYAHNLVESRMPIIPHEDCLDRHQEFYNQFLSSKSFCAGYRNGTSVCNGDSGGGMFIKDDNDVFRIIGIVSLGMATDNLVCNPYQYVLFTNVGRYTDWIENKITDIL